MLTSTQLIEQLSTAIGKQRILKLSSILKEQHFPLRDIIDLTFYPDKAISFRMAWLLENILLTAPERYSDDLVYMISRFKDVKYEGCMRHYAKVLMHITDAKAPEQLRVKLIHIDFEPVVEQLFDWLINPKTKVAVKMFAGNALFNLKNTFPWVAEELTGQLEFLMRDGSAGIQSAGKKILKEIKK